MKEYKKISMVEELTNLNEDDTLLVIHDGNVMRSSTNAIAAPAPTSAYYIDIEEEYGKDFDGLGGAD